MGSFPHASIAAMNGWDFWALPSSLDVLEEDVPFLDKPPHLVPAAARERIHNAGMKAAMALRDAEVGLPWGGKPS